MRSNLVPYVITALAFVVAAGAVCHSYGLLRLPAWLGKPGGGGTNPEDKRPSSETPHLYRSVRVLCIGIDEYLHKGGVSPTPCAQRDAEAVGRALWSRYRYRPEYLLGPHATRAALLARLEALDKDLGPEDALIVFYAGHGQVIALPDGSREGFLLPYDANVDLQGAADPDRWRGQALRMQDLVDAAKRMRARHVLVIADACCSGFMARRGKWAERWDLHALATEPSRAVLAATTDRQFATADPTRQHGHFTSALLAALNGVEAASVTDVFVRVREEVARASGRSMTPQMSSFGAGNGEFIFLPDRLPDQEVREAIAQLAAEGFPAPGTALRGVADSVRRRAGLVVPLSEVVESFEAPEYRHGDQATAQGREWERRYHRYEEAAGIGDPNAMAALHYCYSRGLGTEVKPQLAYKWARSAFETGAPVGQHVLGRSMVHGIGTLDEKVNPVEGYKLIRGAAGERSPVGWIQVGLDAAEAGDLASARRALENARQAGVWSARYYLACLDIGVVPGIKILRGVTPDPQAALRQALPAAEHGLPLAQTFVAQLYANWVEPPDPEEARLWIERSAKAGDAQAAGWLAQALAGNAVIPDVLPLKLKLVPNPAQAFRWAESAAKQGHSEGHLALACLYEAGYDGLARNPAKALGHAEKAAAANNPGAFVLLSKWCMPGSLVRRADLDEAARYAFQAADRQDLRGYVWLGALYCDGKIPESFLKSDKDRWNGIWIQKHNGMHYFTIAASLGHPGAKEAIKDLAAEVRKEPMAPHWRLFQKHYPESASEFRRLTGLGAGGGT